MRGIANERWHGDVVCRHVRVSPLSHGDKQRRHATLARTWPDVGHLGIDQPLVIREAHADGPSMRARLEDDFGVFGQALVHEGRQIVEVSEGRFGPDLGVREELGQVGLVGQEDVAGLERLADLLHVQLQGRRQDAQHVPVVRPDQDGLGQQVSADVLLGRDFLAV